MKRIHQNGKKFIVMLLACLVMLGGVPIFPTWFADQAYASVDEEWAALGNAGFSEGEASAPKLAVDQSGNTYIAYTDIGADYKATVMKYSVSDGWQLVGERGLSSGSASGITLVLDQQGTIYRLSGQRC